MHPTHPGFSRALVLIALLLLGCGEPSPRAPSIESDSAGVTIVTNRRPAMEAAFTLLEPPLLEIGGEEGPYEFGRVTHALLGAERFLVVDAVAREIRAFSLDGRHLATYGRAGEGPGEFREISALLPLPGGVIAAYDPLSARMTTFRPGNPEPDIVPAPEGENYRPLGATADGTILFFDARQRGGDRPPVQGPDSAEVIALRPDGSIVHVGHHRVVDLGDPVPLRLAVDDGYYWGTSDANEIRRYDLDGRLRRISRILVAGRPVRGDESAAASGTSFVDRDGRLWLARATSPDTTTAPHRWTILDPSGIWLADAALPAQFRALDARGDIVLGAWSDPDGTHRVALHLLASAPTSS